MCRCGNRLLNSLNVIYYAYAASLSYLIHYATSGSDYSRTAFYHLPLAAGIASPPSLFPTRNNMF